MRLLRQFVTRYPWQSVLLILILLAAGIADGLGLSALLPMLNLAFDSGGSAPAGGALPEGGETPDDDFSRQVTRVLGALGLSPTLGTLLTVIVLGISIKRVFIFIAEQRIGYIAVGPKVAESPELLGALAFATRTLGFVNAPGGKRPINFLKLSMAARFSLSSIWETPSQKVSSWICWGSRGGVLASAL